MRTATVFSAIVALSSNLVAAADCSSDITLTDAVNQISCDTVQGDVIVDSKVAGAVSISGPKEITGSLIIKDNKNIDSITSTIQKIGGTLRLNGLTGLTTVSLASLSSVNTFEAVALGRLNSFTFGKNGVAQAQNITIQDTFISDLSGFNPTGVHDLKISSNQRLNIFDTDLKGVAGLFYIINNGNQMTVNATSLESVGEIQLRGVAAFNAPALKTISSSIRFDTNPELTSFVGGNITSLTGSITFNKNPKLTNISFPLLTKIKKGDMTITDNAKLTDLTGFPKLSDIDGAMKIVGAFTNVNLPALSSVVGAVNANSTTTNSTFCDYFNGLKTKKIVQNEKCVDHQKTGDDSKGGSSGSGSGSDDKTKDGAAGAVGVNMAMLGLAAFAGAMQLL